jgi:hypothetical protein
MIPLDELVPSYRRARDRWIDAPTLARHYDTVAEAYSGSGQSLIECVKSYLECVCRTIMADYGVAVYSEASTTELLIAALERLGLRNSRGASRFDRVLSAHNRLADALSEVRNHDAPVAHGKDGFLDALASHHVRLYLLTGDTILSLLLGALDGTEPNLIHTREPYERFDHFNSAIDSIVSVKADVEDDGIVVLEFRTAILSEGLKLRVEPSRLLYGMDRGAYVEVLESLPSTFEVDEGTDAPRAEGTPALPPLASAATAPIRPRIVESYVGRFAGLKPELEKLLSHQGVPSSVGSRVLDSLLAAFDDAAVLDWQHREPMRARVLVSLKRVLRSAGPRHPPPHKLAAVVLQWLVENEPAADATPRGDRKGVEAKRLGKGGASTTARMGKKP